VSADLGSGAHLLGHRERTLEQLVKRAAQHPGFVGHADRRLHLAQDLRLAEHHRIEARCDAKGVARGGLVVHHITVLLQLGAADATVFRKPVEAGSDQVMDQRARRGDVQLGAVASRDQRGFRQRALETLPQTMQGGVICSGVNAMRPRRLAGPSCGSVRASGRSRQNSADGTIGRAVAPGNLFVPALALAALAAGLAKLLWRRDLAAVAWRQLVWPAALSTRSSSWPAW
jgi:hypothetical protein